MLVSLTITML